MDLALSQIRAREGMSRCCAISGDLFTMATCMSELDTDTRKWGFRSAMYKRTWKTPLSDPKPSWAADSRFILTCEQGSSNPFTGRQDATAFLRRNWTKFQAHACNLIHDARRQSHFLPWPRAGALQTYQLYSLIGSERDYGINSDSRGRELEIRRGVCNRLRSTGAVCTQTLARAGQFGDHKDLQNCCLDVTNRRTSDGGAEGIRIPNNLVEALFFPESFLREISRTPLASEPPSKVVVVWVSQAILLVVKAFGMSFFRSCGRKVLQRRQNLANWSPGPNWTAGEQRYMGLITSCREGIANWKIRTVGELKFEPESYQIPCIWASHTHRICVFWSAHQKCLSQFQAEKR